MSTTSFTEQMLGTFVNLTAPSQAAPVHVWRPWLSWQKCIGTGVDQDGNLQRLLPPGFRDSIAVELGGVGRFAVKHPDELHQTLVTDAWLIMCELLRSYEALAPQRQAALLSVLLSLGFYETVVQIGRMPDANSIAQIPAQASIGLTVAAATTILATTGVGNYDLAMYESIATHAPPGSRARFAAALELIVQHAKFTGNVDAADHWRTQAKAAMDVIVSDLGRESFASHLLLSRFYRSASYVPYMRGQRSKVVDEMDQCEYHALAMNPHTDRQTLLTMENRIPMLQSRAKEARWLGDLPLALSRLERARDTDPLDAMRWIELGEVHLDLNNHQRALDCYITAARLAPPGGAVAWHMAGEAARLCGLNDRACCCYLHALAIDSLSVASAQQLKALACTSTSTRSLVKLAQSISSLQQRHLAIA